ncbi:succinate dehydrogenase assembly factor 2 [Rehaibacterium terrae]|jgi:antitoxin CptB|uniref:FAD assembly factor SdhE n=1 Tax=Rehaibacterium terrae TaxID=1341696 RepID=A0A7W7Y1M9_9GAMM|nr:succinate dehydrogenase assembly factor 2 [Rehaibacterium terrae]MBB5016213.1 antitoxin CptB [Rehaibacterium terrae]
MSEEAELRRLRWRCRRGMRELDQLMLRYLERRWPQADTAERAVFERLLDTEDDRLWRWFMGREAVEETELRDIVERILALPH